MRRANAVSLFLPLWEAACRRALAGFRRRLAIGPSGNTLTLRRILRRHADSEFGRRHRFAELLREPDLETAWADALPVADYGSFREDVARMANGEPDILFPGRPRLFVSSSGTTGDPKLFPVTRRQQNAALSVIALLMPAARACVCARAGFPTANHHADGGQSCRTANRCRHTGGQSERSGAAAHTRAGSAVLGVPRIRTRCAGPPNGALPTLHALFALRARDLGCIEAIYCSHIVSWMALYRAAWCRTRARYGSGQLVGRPGVEWSGAGDAQRCTQTGSAACRGDRT